MPGLSCVKPNRAGYANGHFLEDKWFLAKSGVDDGEPIRSGLQRVSRQNVKYFFTAVSACGVIIPNNRFDALGVLLQDKIAG